MQRLFNRIYFFVLSLFLFFSCSNVEAHDPVYLWNQTYLDALKTLELTPYALNMDILPESYAHHQTMHGQQANVPLFKGEQHGIGYSVNTSPLSIMYAIRDIVRFIFKHNANIPRYRDFGGWVDHFIKQFQLKRPENLAPENYFATFTADIRKEILHNYGFYDNPAFIEFIKTFPEYEQHIIASNTARELIREQLLKIDNLDKNSIDRIINDVVPELAKKIVDNQQERIQASQAQRLQYIIERRESVAQKQSLQTRLEVQEQIIQRIHNAPEALHERNAAIGATLGRADPTMETINTPIDERSAQLLGNAAVPREFFEKCIGNKVQHQLHREFGHLLKEVSVLPSKELKVVLTDQIVVGQELNHLGYVSEGYAFADFCHTVLDLTKGVGKGAWHSLCNLGYSIFHPIETITTAGKGVVNLADFFYQMVKLDIHLLKVNLKNITDSLHLIYSHFKYGRESTLEKMREITREHEARNAAYNAVYEQFKEGIRSLTAEKVGEEAGKFATDIYLFGRISKAASNFSKFTKTRLLKVLEKIAKSGPTAEKIVLATAEGVEVASSAEKIAQEAQALQHAVQDGSKVVQQTGQLEKAAADSVAKNIGKAAEAGSSIISDSTKVSTLEKPVIASSSESILESQSLGTYKILPNEGCIINGRYYTKHVLERMAPKTPQVLAELEARALAKGYARGTKKFIDYVNPRDIPLLVVEDTIENGLSKIGREPGTIEYITEEIKVITNLKGDVISVFRN